MRRVWYVAYGSNTHTERLASYLRGGRPEGAARTYPGCRDRSAPVASVAVELPGTVYFATRSPVWSGGGRAFYDPDAPGRALARARLVTVAQFSDIAAQEMYREPGEGPDLDLREVLARGRSVQGEGRYETLVCPGELSGHPLLTFTAPWSVAEAELNAPAAGYLAYLAGGLLAAGAWDAGSVAAYLANCPGAAGTWSERAVRELLGHGARS